jgi:hypothetical protein
VLAFVSATTMIIIAVAVGSSDSPGLIDDTALISVIEDACDDMTAEVTATPITGSPQHQAAAITKQNRAVEDMVSEIRLLGPEVLDADPPTNAWLSDWDRLVEARKAYTEDMLRGSSTDLRIPKDSDGDDIYLRMDDVFFYESTCEVPKELLNPYPDDSSDA